MPFCPRCKTALRTVRQREGIFFHCPACDGRAVTVPQIRRVAGDRYAVSILRQINANRTLGSVPCPFCDRRMRVFASAEPPQELDACKPCGAVWFDPREFESIPAGAPDSEYGVRLRAAEAMAEHRLETDRSLRDLEGIFGQSADPPDEGWKAIPAFFGFPVESEGSPVSRVPWVTWLTAALVVVFSSLAFRNLPSAVQQFGMIPADWARWGGATLLTSFFLHAGIGHLCGNLYFLLVFGDNVEDYLGHARALLVLVGATLMGSLVHVVADPSTTTPCIGASGGISGVIVFYALQFPHAKLGFFIRLHWLHLPAWFALVVWILLQLVGYLNQRSGHSSVAATAHLGGALMGAVLWAFWRKR
jgi:membrane associated rhomboid family serine protease/Zn-finger nucleic acid-binding protein